MFCTLTASGKSKKSITVNYMPAADCCFSRVVGIVNIAAGNVSEFYAVEESPTDDDARMIGLHKCGDESALYWVRVRPDMVEIAPAVTVCGCKGFKYHSTCKHADAINELIRRNAI